MQKHHVSKETTVYQSDLENIYITKGRLIFLSDQVGVRHRLLLNYAKSLTFTTTRVSLVSFDQGDSRTWGPLFRGVPKSKADPH